MPTLKWLKQEFDYGYDSGNVLSLIPDRTRRSEEKKIGGSYRRVFNKAIAPHLRPDSSVLELGPGRGAWSRAILKNIPEGQLTTVDFQDVTEWIDPGDYGGRLKCIQVSDNSFSGIEDNSIDFFWSMGVLCHNNVENIERILRNALPKMKPGGIACHQFADWEKLKSYGWDRGGVPTEFQSLADDEIWWPRNDRRKMQEIANSAGWNVENIDMNLVARDSIACLSAPV